MANIAVVGAGVVGLSTAVAIQQRVPRARVTVIADKFTKDTTSDGSGGIFVPLATGTDDSLVRKWGKEGAAHFYKLAFSDQSRDAGVYTSHGYHLSTEPITQKPTFLDFTLSYRKMNEEELGHFQPFYKDGYVATTAIIECRYYLPWLTDRLTEKGGRIEKRRIHSFDELAGQYDVVVNCTGLGSMQLTSDPLLQPMRGQVVRIYAPWIKFFIHADDKVYVLPSSENVVIGSTKELGKTDLSPNAEDHKTLLDRAMARVPALKGAKILFDWVGLRPYRSSPRVEREVRTTAAGRPQQVVHNYGHGTVGVTLSWGTAVHAAELVQEALGPSSRL